MPPTSPPAPPATAFPPTRYQGSKRRWARQIVAQLEPFGATTVLDAFAGTGAVAYAFKQAGYAVTYNDRLGFNQQVGLALVENDGVTLALDDARQLGTPRPGRRYADFIERTFAGIYFTDTENRWLDVAAGNLQAITDRYARALAYHAVFQAALAKRPYNLFHRANLYMRTAQVERSFGNKATWDRPFADHVEQAGAAANAAVFAGRRPARALANDARELPTDFNLVYIDPPYVNGKGVGVDYRDFYHFLEGFVQYDEWPALLDRRSKHRRLTRTANPWTRGSTCRDALRDLLHHFRASVLAISYRSDGQPTPDEILTLLREVKPHAQVCDDHARQYALSTRRSTRQLLFVGW